MWSDPTVGDPFHQCLLGQTGSIGLLVFPGTGENPDDREIFQERQVHWQLRYLPAGEAYRQQPTTPAHRPGKLLEHAAANIVEADVDTPSIGQLLEPVTQLFGAVVYDLTHAALAQGRRMPIRAHRRNNPPAEMARDIDRGHADAPSSAGNDDGLARAQLRPEHERIVFRFITVNDGRPQLDRHSVRNPNRFPFLGAHALAKPADPVQACRPIT